jgi:hypothetical protein
LPERRWTPTQGAGDRAFGVTQAGIEQVAASPAPGTSAGFLLIEHAWARDLKRRSRPGGRRPSR